MPRRYSLTIEDRKFRVGRIQRQCRRALVVYGQATIRELLEWSYPRATTYLPWMRTSVHRAIKKFGVPARPTRERFASIWTLREQHDATRTPTDQQTQAQIT